MPIDQDFDYDLLIVGAGSGGLAAAKCASSLGVRVGLIEEEAIGGTCVNRGCVPKKLMFYAAQFAHETKLARSFAWQEAGATDLDWQKFRQLIEKQILTIQDSMRSSLEKSGTALIQGKASFQDHHCLRINSSSSGESILSAQHILIAVGSKPKLLDIPGIELALTSRDIFKLASLPKSLLIVGGGYIGVEFAGILNAFGVKIILVDTSERILSGFDSDVRCELHEFLEKQGIKMVMQSSLDKIEAHDSYRRIYLSASEHEQQIVLEAEAVLIATGREPNLDELALNVANVKLEESGAIAVDFHSRTSQNNIYAVGDCTARLPLTPVAKAEAKAVIDTLYGSRPTVVDYRWVPSAVYAYPPAASVGWIEAEAREKLSRNSKDNQDITVYKTHVSPLRQSLEKDSKPAFIKFIVEQSSDQVLGLHVIGEQAADLVQAMTPALQAGIRFSELQKTIAIHPTFGEELLTF